MSGRAALRTVGAIEHPRVPNIGSPALPARDDRDWVLSAELMTEADITYRRLDYWTRTGLLTPREDISGTGWTRSYPADQVARARLVAQLLEAGMSLQTIRDVIDEVQRTGRVEIAGITITVHNPAGAA